MKDYMIDLRRQIVYVRLYMYCRVLKNIEEHVTFQTGTKFEITGVFAWFPTQKPEWNGENSIARR